MGKRNHSLRGLTRRLLAVSVVGLLALAAPAAASAADRYVATTGNDMAGANDCLTQASPCLTVQQAVTKAVAGDVVNVAAGTYTAAVTVNKQLTLSGAEAGVDARTRSGVPETVIKNATVTAGNQTGVVIDGFTIEATVTGVGIQLSGNATNAPQILNNVIRSHGRGIQLTSNSGPTLIRHNVFANNPAATGMPTGAIYSDGPLRGITVEENTFTNNSLGVFINPDNAHAPAQDIDILNNRFDGNGNATVLFKTDGATVSGNTAVGSTSTQFFFGGADHGIEVTDNTIRDGKGTAIAVSDVGFGANSGLVATGNTITGNGAAALNVGSATYSGAMAFNFNRIVGNGSGVTDNFAGGPIDAEDNWWGCNAGPGAPGCEQIAGSAAAGVDFDPWLVLRAAASPDTVAAGGATSAVTAGLDTNSDGATPSLNTLPEQKLVFGAALGTIDPPDAFTSGQLAGATFTSGAVPGAANATATLDNQTVFAPITIPGPGGGGGQGASAGQQIGSLRIIKVKLRKKKGKARLLIAVPADGYLGMRGKRLRPRSRSFGAGATTTRFTVKARGKAKRKLLRRGKAKVKILLKFTATDGSVQTLKRRIRLRRSGRG